MIYESLKDYNTNSKHYIFNIHGAMIVNLLIV